MTKKKSFDADIAIIGAGPVGLFAVFECGMLDMTCHVIDTLDFVGGQCQALYPEKPIYDIPAFPQVQAAELVGRLKEQAAPFKPTYHLGQQVTNLTKEGDTWVVTTSKQTVIRAKAVIIAAGAGAFGPNRPPLDDIESYEGQSVFYMVERREAFQGKKIAIAGGGDSAVDWALSLSELAEKIYIIHRRDRFRAAPDSVNKMKKIAQEMDKIELVIPYALSRLEGHNGQLSAVEVKTLEGKTRLLDVDTLMPFFGLSSNLGPIAEWGFSLNKNQIIINPATCETTVDGIYAIGDIASYDGKLKLILQGFSEGAVAAHAAYKRVFPDRVLNFAHSTDKGVPTTG